MRNLNYFFSLLPLVLFAFWLKKPAGLTTTPVRTDGPYVLYSKDSVFVHYIYEENGLKILHTDTTLTSARKDIQLNISTGNPEEFFTVRLKPKLQQEKS